MLKKIFFALCMAFAASQPPTEAVELKEITTPGAIVRYEPPLERAAADMAAAYPGIKADVEAKLGWRINSVPRIVLVHQHAEFRKETGSDLVTAFAVPAAHLIVMDYSKMERTPFDLRATLEHELCHLLLHENIGASFLPKWLDEGTAQWVAGTADIIATGEKDILKQAVLSGNLLRLKDISINFPEQPRAILLAYEESRSFTEFIVHEYGAGKFLSVLDGLHKKMAVEQAVQGNLSIGLDVLEENWRRSLLRSYSWQAYLADHLYWVLFFLAALGTIWGYLRLRNRIRNYRDEEDDGPPEEGETGEDPEDRN